MQVGIIGCFATLARRCVGEARLEKSLLWPHGSDRDGGEEGDLAVLFAACELIAESVESGEIGSSPSPAPR